MAEDDTLKRVEDDEETPQIAVPSHSPLPPPPDIQFTRPVSVKPMPHSPHPLGAASSGTVQEDDASPGSSAVKLGSGLAAATTFAASIIAGFLIGQWIDHRWNHGGGLPWGTLVFALAGVAAGFLNLFRVLSATDRSRNKK
jgi:F0F1-type ATP synthase assembly protein I